ncbi:hypothetical protein [Saccharopolyspora gloriosae]|uniref:hypothetical protein n=1 Tax=Saccharopolyspora gloriosae TaxID=455344 RepID=UPI001FB62D7B|nr:hypothetical protein [Saccharopolyspora gloriosae]
MPFSDLVGKFFAIIEHFKPPVVSASASLLSVLVSSIVAFFAYRAYRKQAAQLSLARSQELRQQSSKFTAWLEDDPGLKHIPGEMLVGTAYLAWDVLRYINASDLPVYNVALVYKDQTRRLSIVHRIVRIMPTNEDHGSNSVKVKDAFPRSIKLASELRASLPDEAAGLDAAEWYEAAIADGGVRSTIAEAKVKIKSSIQEEWFRILDTGAVHFDDCEGNRWRRQLDGKLRLLGYARGGLLR